MHSESPEIETNPDSIELFEERYRIVTEPAMVRAEQRVIGCTYGATSYTTRRQADRLGQTLGLEPGARLLDIGSGAGWPAIYLARTTGCSVVLADVPVEGLRHATRRIQEEHVDGGAVAASGTELPFRDRAFEAVTSSDVFC